MLLLILVLVLNVAISFWNARVVGQTWAESKVLGGWLHFVTWSALVQSAVGFSILYVLLIGGAVQAMGWLPPKVLHATLSLWYLAVIFPVLGSGIALTIQSWIVAFRERSLSGMGVAGWNTFASVSNAMDAASGLGTAFKGVGDLFDGDSEDSSGALFAIALTIVVAALGAGAATTWAIVRRYRNSLPVPVRAPA